MRTRIETRLALAVALAALLAGCGKQTEAPGKPPEGRAQPAVTAPAQPQMASYDVVVYGGTSAGITAAVAAARDGEKVLMLEPSYLIGGMMTAGLTKTDMGRTDAIGGMAREFYDRVLAYYTKTYGADSQQVFQCNHGYYFESKVAGEIFRQMLDEAHVTVMTKERLEQVDFTGPKISSITTRNYQTDQVSSFGGKVFIDATYEGDLIAQAHALYRVGREARCEFNESMAGLTEGPEQYRGGSDGRVQSFNIRGGFTDLPNVRLPFPKPTHYYREMVEGQIQTVLKKNLHKLRDLYPNFDQCAKINGHYDVNSGDCPGVQFDYIESDYEGRERIAQKVRDHWLSLWWGLQNDPALPADFRADMMTIGVPNDEYMESDHVTPNIYVRVGRRLLGDYFLTQHDLVEDRFKTDAVCMGNYGFDSHKVQFIRTPVGLRPEGEISGSTDLYDIPYRCLTYYAIPNLLDVATISASYVANSSLRMEPTYMMLGQAGGIAAHLANVGNVAVQDIPIAALQDELRKTGVPLEPLFRPVVELQVLTPPPYKPGQAIKFKLVPKLVHAPLKTIAWNFDGTGAVQATTAAATYTYPLARKATVKLQVTDGDHNQGNTQSVDLVIGDNPVPDVDADRSKVKLVGHWYGERGGQMDYYYRMGEVDMPGRGDEPTLAPGAPKQTGDGQCQAIFTAKLSRSGRYKVAMAYPSTDSAATNTQVTITTADGEVKKTINQKVLPPFAFSPLGEFKFNADQPAVVTVTNAGADGRVAVDAVRFIWEGE